MKKKNKILNKLSNLNFSVDLNNKKDYINKMKIKTKKNMYVECFSGMSSSNMYVERGSEFEVEYRDEEYEGKDGCYCCEDEYFGEIYFSKDKVKVI